MGVPVYTCLLMFSIKNTVNIIKEDEMMTDLFKQTTDEERTITPEQLKEKLTKEDIVIVDVREVDEYMNGHIPNAQSIPLGDLPERLHELNKDKDMYIICHSGRRSTLAAEFLESNGFNKLINVVPGMMAWNGKLTTP